MAEVAVGLVASVAGLVGLAGQLGQGCLFVKGFLDDAKNAPEDIRDLHAEMEILASEAGKVSTLFANSNQSPQIMEGYEAALKQCVDAVTALGEKIEKDVKRFGREGTGKWWDRMKAATRKKSLGGELVKVERAKTQLMMVMQGLSMNLQHDQHLSTESANMGIHDQGNTIIAWTGRAEETMADIRDQENTMISWTSRADETMTNIHSQGHTIKAWTGQAEETMASILSRVKEVKGSIDELPRQSVLESMMERAMQKVLKQHTNELHQQDQSGESTSRINEDNANVESCESNETRGKNNSHYKPGCDSQTITRRGKIIHRTRCQTRLFDIDIVTSEYQYRDSRDTSDWIEASTRTKQDTKYNFRIRSLGLLYRSGNPNTFYDPGLCRSFRAYNIVPNNAPIMNACRRFDLLEVRRLFEAGLASPLDQDEFGFSLVNNVIHYLWRGGKIDFIKAASAVGILKFLIDCLGGDLGPLRNLSELFHTSGKDANTLAQLSTAFRLLIAHTSEDPFNYCRPLAECINLDLTRTPVYQVILGQQKWWIDLDPKSANPEAFEGCFVENDMMMLKDIKGLSVRTALCQGLSYIPYSSTSYHWEFFEQWMYSPLHFVLVFISNAKGPEQDRIKKCCINRLVILLESGCDPHYTIRFSKEFLYGRWPLGKFISPTEVARIYDLLDLWESSLSLAGWSPSEIQDLFDESIYAGIPELIEGRLNFTTLDEQRRGFIEALRRGTFKDLEESELQSLYRTKLSLELDLSWWDIESMIREVTSVILQRSTPGSWQEEEEVKLIPGVDFKLSYWVRDWKCVREIWDHELGCIPPGYEGWDELSDESEDEE